MAFKINSGKTGTSYNTRGLSATGLIAATEGSTRSSVNPMDEVSDRDSYQGSDSGYRKSLNDQLEIAQATAILHEALKQTMMGLRDHLVTAVQIRIPQRLRLLQQEYNHGLVELDDLTRPEQWEGTAVHRLFSIQLADVLDELPEDFSIRLFSPKSLGLSAIQLQDSRQCSRGVDNIDQGLEYLAALQKAANSATNQADNAIATMPHGRSTSRNNAPSIQTVEFASKTANWLRAAMLADGKKAILVQAHRISPNALHLVG